MTIRPAIFALVAIISFAMCRDAAAQTTPRFELSIVLPLIRFASIDPEREWERHECERRYGHPEPGIDALPHWTEWGTGGRFELAVGGSAGTMGTLRSMTLNGRELTMSRLDLSERDNAGNIRLVFKGDASQLTARVVDRANEPVWGDVVVFPEDYKAWLASNMPTSWFRHLRVSVGQPAQLVGLPEGRYLIAAYANERALVPGLVKVYPVPNWIDPRLVERLAASATRAVIRAGTNAPVQVIRVVGVQ